jgi:small-conductance mechanosensitive channel
MKIVFFVLLSLILSTSLLFADINSTAPLSEKELKALEVQKKEFAKEEKIATLKSKLQAIDKEINQNNVWIKSYSSYLTSLEIKNSLGKIKKRIAYLAKYAKTTSDRDELNALISKENILSLQVEKLKGESDAPFSKLITPPAIHENIDITNPFDIFTGISLIKTLNENVDDYKKKKENLKDLVMILRKENGVYKDIIELDSDKSYKKAAKEKKMQLERFETALDTMSVTLNIYQKRLEIVETSINKGIETQVYRLAKIGTIILVVFIISLLLKLVIKKYITDNQRFYMANKIITFGNFTLIILILFFNYIENAGYLVTILGFASAGIAIAMKDWFMSILGWLVIVIGGSINVGDRIRVDMDGMKYVGDVMDISLLRMTLLEDVTLTSVLDNRRAGRIIFIPNNYVFTRMISNYTHNSLKTVWDGISIVITFDSNHKKAMHLTKEIAKKFSKGYTDITRKQLNKLRQHYSLKNTNVEPRVNALIHENGLNIETWYLTNAYATLTLRTVISTEIVDAFNKEDDITIAYPTQKLNVSMKTQETSAHQHEIV